MPRLSAGFFCYMSIVKYAIVGLCCFGAGCHLTETKWERDFGNYQISEKERAEAERIAWDEKLRSVEYRLADLRRDESSARAESERLRQQVAKLQRGAKTSEAVFGARLAGLAVRQKELIDRASVGLEFCSEVLR